MNIPFFLRKPVFLPKRAENKALILRKTQKSWQSFLGIPRNEIGTIGQGKVKRGKKLTIATIQTLTKEFHDYSNDQKGFVIWKDLLEERLA